MSHCPGAQTSGISIDPNNSFYAALEQFYFAYKPVHASLGVFICTAGILLNVANIVVLTRRSMRSCINMILTAIAIGDIGLMTSYFIFLSHFVLLYTSACDPVMNSYAWAYFQLAHANFSVLAHNLSLWLTVVMAVVRYVAVKQKHKTTFNKTQTAYPLIGLTFLLVLLFCVPNFMTYAVRETSQSEMGCLTTSNRMSHMTTTAENNTTAHARSTTTPMPSPSTSEIGSLVSYTSTLNGSYLFYDAVTPLPRSPTSIPVHMAPRTDMPNVVTPEYINLTSVVPTGDDAQIVNYSKPTTRVTVSRRRSTVVVQSVRYDEGKLYWVFFSSAYGSCTFSKVSFWIGGIAFKIVPCILLSVFMGLLLQVLVDASSRRKRLKNATVRLSTSLDAASKGERTTTMLILIVFVFLLTEAPQGILAVLSGIFDYRFYDNVYKSVGDMLDMLSLVNSCVNFVLYCTMSKKYRLIFCEIFLPHRFLLAVNLFYATAMFKGAAAMKKPASRNASNSPYHLCLSSPNGEGIGVGGTTPKRWKPVGVVQPLILENRAAGNAQFDEEDESEMVLYAMRLDVEETLLNGAEFASTPRDTESTCML